MQAGISSIHVRITRTSSTWKTPSRGLMKFYGDGYCSNRAEIERADTAASISSSADVSGPTFRESADHEGRLTLRDAGFLNQKGLWPARQFCVKDKQKEIRFVEAIDATLPR
ncbi:hypothetical protein KM043_001973 [Ampulex compressa]|nr:hypothetical protein KM043_001973 [Ampulex compressa]